MSEEPLIISKMQIDALIRRLEDAGLWESAATEVRRMRDIMLDIVWRSDLGT